MPLSSSTESVSATGGSAGSQATDLSERSWKPRRALALMVTGLRLAIPIAASYLVSRLVVTAIPRPSGLVALVLWSVLMIAVAVVVLRVAERYTRRLLPLSALLKMSLVFPDNAPSRFGTALRSGSGKSLERATLSRNAESEMDTPQELAERIVELIGALRIHDPKTRGHSERVRAYCDLIAKELNLPEEDAWRLHWGALIHDLGKLDVRPETLNKPGRPDEDEWKEIKGHPNASLKYTDGLDVFLGPWVLAATQHHERFDGKGYPLGLAGTEISLAGRIVAVADAFDVMTAARSYKKPLPMAQARAELADNAGTQFDPTIVKAMLAVSIGDLRWQRGPLALLGNLPALLQAPLATTASATTSVATAAGTAALVTVAAAAGPSMTFAAHGQAAAAERAAFVSPTTTTLVVGSEDSLSLSPSTSAKPKAAPTTTSGPTTSSTTLPSQLSEANTPSSTTPKSPSTKAAPSTTSVPKSKSAPATTTAPPSATTGQHDPTVVADTFAVEANSGKRLVDVLANDSDVDGNLDPSTLRVTFGPLNFTRAKIVGGKVEYTTGAGYFNDGFFYEVCDTTGRCKSAWVTLDYRSTSTANDGGKSSNPSGGNDDGDSGGKSGGGGKKGGKKGR